MSHRITDWDPEDVVAWEARNKNIARRNLLWSVAKPALIVVAVLIGLVLVKRAIVWIVRQLRRTWAAQTQPGQASAANRRSSSTA